MAAASRLKGAELLAHPLAGAALAAVREHGYEAITTEDILERAGVGREEFERAFDGKEDLVTLVIEAQIEAFVERVSGAYASVEGWPGNLRAAAYETARYVRDNPDMTWVATIGVMRERETARAYRDRVFRWASGMIDAGRGVAADPEAIPASAPLVAVGGIADVLRRNFEGAGVPVSESLPRMMYAAVRPYLGEEAASAELGIPLPPDLRDG
jgi:AcrR family transcriptional regulator